MLLASFCVSIFVSVIESYMIENNTFVVGHVSCFYDDYEVLNLLISKNL